MRKKKSHVGWTLKPGERYNMNAVMEKVIEVYCERHPDDRIMIFNETDEMVYFVHMHPTERQILLANVAMLYKDSYRFLPQDMALEISKSYLLQIELTAEAYEYLEQTYGE